ncbi:UNKNOWN [Stylonychia lemnae]|uniref:Transmembrane protein n=1 Tax=Stylonychia lemnae TaxID=5949 RepID=A0A078B730_STYLE|nr:UNKNOWN [Stylonychia lemnae]|eukprot:CDW90199.1 UNKNOWN [Stylonychia lemnae]
MKSIPQKIDHFLWSSQEEYFNNVGYSAPFTSFVNMQIVRLVSLLLILVIWVMNFYINVKKVVIYLNFWALTFTLLSLGFLFVSSGRQVIEKKLKERGEPVEEKDRSHTWKKGVLFYTLAWPFTVASNVTFFTFFYKDQTCQTYIDFGFEQWRGYVIFLSVIMPLVALIVDFFINRLVMSQKHMILTVLLTVLYIFLSFLGSLAQNRPVYGDHLGYVAHDDFKYEYMTLPKSDWGIEKLQECKDYYSDWFGRTGIQPNWTKTGVSLATIFGTIILSHLIITAISNIKSKRYFLRDGKINEQKALLLDKQSSSEKKN